MLNLLLSSDNLLTSYEQLQWLLGLTKNEVFRKIWNFPNRTYFASCIMRKYHFLLWTKETAFFPYFCHKIIFYSAELFWLRSQLKILLEHLHIFKHIHQRSNIWIKKQPLISGSPVQRTFGSKVSGLQFHRCFILYECFGGFWSHFSDLFFAELLIA